jgi:hypothetical protein
LSNELRILPLRKYEATYIISIDQNDEERTDTFTADYHDVKEGRNLFYRTGNVIREYQMPLIRIVATPVDSDEKIPS